MNYCCQYITHPLVPPQIRLLESPCTDLERKSLWGLGYLTFCEEKNIAKLECGKWQFGRTNLMLTLYPMEQESQETNFFFSPIRKEQRACFLLGVLNLFHENDRLYDWL